MQHTHIFSCQNSLHTPEGNDFLSLKHTEDCNTASWCLRMRLLILLTPNCHIHAYSEACYTVTYLIIKFSVRGLKNAVKLLGDTKEKFINQFIKLNLKGTTLHLLSPHHTSS